MFRRLTLAQERQARHRLFAILPENSNRPSAAGTYDNRQSPMDGYDFWTRDYCMTRFVLALLCLTLALISAPAKTTDPAPVVSAATPLSNSLITTAGTYVFNEGLIIEVQEFPHALTAYKIKKIEAYTKNSKPTSLEGPQEMIKSDSGWFIYPESSSRIWVYEGNLYLVLHEIVKNTKGDGPHIKSISSADSMAIVKQAPKIVIDRYTVELKKKTTKGK